MIIIIGLGNPGQKYTYTRHNIGFQVIDEFARKNKFPEFRLSKRFKSLISEKDNIVLAKPQTFMNNSGAAVKKILKFTETRVSVKNRDPGLCLNLYVVHDDIDLVLGKIKVVKNRGAAGHKGVESIIKEIKTKDFVRFRIGIQPRLQRGKPKNVEKFVLQRFTEEEKKVIKEAVKETIKKLS